MISVIIPTLNAEDRLAETLSALVPAAVDGLVKEVIVVDGGSSDRTAAIVDQAGANFVSRSGGRGYQLDIGARRARFPWLLFLHADTLLEPGWEREVVAFMERIEKQQRPVSAAAFRFALDDMGFMPRLLERLVALRCTMFGLPYGDQGLLISRKLYSEVKGFRPLPLMEDVDLAKRLGRRRITLLGARAITSPVRFRRDGYFRRSLRNLFCLLLYHLRVPAHAIGRIYERGSRPPHSSIKSL